MHITLPGEVEIEELSDFSMPLSQFTRIARRLLRKYGPDAIIIADAGYNNMGVSVQPAPAKKRRVRSTNR